MSDVKQTGRARLADDGRYLGIDVIDAADLANGDVEVPVECDLAVGKYRWDGTTFVPVRPAEPLSDTPPPAALVAIALGFVACAQQDIKLPEATHAWLEGYLTSIDVRESVARNADAVAYIRSRKESK